MRWERLFADLEAQAEAAEAAEFAGEVVERTRIEVGAVRLSDRLRVQQAPVRLRCLGGESVSGPIERVGPDWLLVGERPDRSALASLAAVISIGGLGRLAAVPGGEGQVGARLDLRHALRGIARDRAPVAITLTDGGTVAGTIDRVRADHVDLAEHPAAEPRRHGAVRTVLALPLSALAVVRSG